MTEESMIDVWTPEFIVPEDPIEGAPAGIGVSVTSCGNPDCGTGCHEVALMVVGHNSMLSFRYETETARQIAAKIIERCDEQDAMTAKHKGVLN
jgi:hypothetical protein